MIRALWDQFMIALMAAVILFSLWELWRASSLTSEGRYLLAIGGAIVVIWLKLNALKKARTPRGSNPGARD